MFLSISLSALILPKPQSYQITDNTPLPVDKLVFTCTTKSSDCLNLIKPQIDFYQKAAFPKGSPKAQSGLSKVSVVLENTEVPRSPFQVNETYQIEVNQSGFFINAANTFALSRALATFAQLIESPAAKYYTRNFYEVKPCKVADFPVYTFRSVLIDTARHYLPVSGVKRQIDAMSITKMNVLHIHIIDDQSNTFQPITAPADKYGNGAYYNGKFYRYSIENMKDISEYALKMGVFIMIEFDLPGHSGILQKIDKSLSANCPSRGFSSVNPLNEQLFVYIKAYLQDIVSTIYKPQNQIPLIHLGGDEVDHNCWKEDKEINEHMQKNGISTQKLWQQFHEKVAKLIDELCLGEVDRIYWQESFQNGNQMNKNAIVHDWYQDVLQKVVSANIRYIRSRGWYLDVQQPGASLKHVWMDTWQDFYQVNIASGVPDDKKHLVLGGGPCAWAERINDANIDGFIWPRAAAAAEALWTAPESRGITGDVTNRMVGISCKLLNVGVAAGVVTPSAPCPGHDDPREPEEY